MPAMAKKTRIEDMNSLLMAPGFSRALLAEKAGLSRPTIDNVIAGEKDAYTDTLAAIAEVLGVPIERVLTAFRATREKAGAPSRCAG